MTAQKTSSSESLLSRVNWPAVSQLVLRELHNRELHAPVVSAYRWWARRPHSVMGALLDAAVAHYGDDLTVSDPFCGGGTVTFEAARRGLRAYAQDLYPWPTHGLATALGHTELTEFDAASRQLLEQLKPLRDAFHTLDNREISHVIRVRAVRCTNCAHEYFLFPQAMISLCARNQPKPKAFFGCIGCGAVSKRRQTIGSFGCAKCGLRHPTNAPIIACPHCGETHKKHHEGVSPFGRWHPVLVQEIVQEDSQHRARLRPVQPGDPVAVRTATGLHPLLDKSIPRGIETKRLLGAGFTRWSDLYTYRQALVLVKALEHLRQSTCAQAVKDRLALAVLGAAEMPAFVSRWDRFNLKPFEGTANHRFSSGTLVVECNPLAPVGRGTLVRRLIGARKALRWLASECTARPKVVSTRPGRPGRRPSNWDVLVATGSSRHQALPNNSVTITLTDPPYHDDVQYGELARLFHVWLSMYAPINEADEQQEAVPNAVRGTSSVEYESTIAACLGESRRTLKRKGCLVLTFHNKSLAAWRALAGALHSSGFQVRALAVVRSENGNDYCKRDVKSILHDLVIECVPRTSKQTDARLEFTPRTTAEKNLAGIGLALAACVKAGTCEQLREWYFKYLSELRTATNLIE